MAKLKPPKIGQLVDLIELHRQATAAAADGDQESGADAGDLWLLIQKRRAQRTKVTGGKRSGEARKRKRVADLDPAAQALNRLLNRNDWKSYGTADIAEESGLAHQRIKRLTRSAVVDRAYELRKTLVKKPPTRVSK